MYTVLLIVPESHPWTCRQTWLTVTEGGFYDPLIVPHARFRLVSRKKRFLQDMTLKWVREAGEA